MEERTDSSGTFVKRKMAPASKLMCENKQMTAASGVLYGGVRFQIENAIVLPAFNGMHRD